MRRNAFRKVRRSSNSDNRRRRMRWLELLEGRTLLTATQYSAALLADTNTSPAPAAPTTVAINEFPLPSQTTIPGSIVAGHDGNYWFTELDGIPGSTGPLKIGEINTTTHTISEFAVADNITLVEDVVAGSDGNIWIAAATGPTDNLTGKLFEFNVATHTVNAFSVGAGDVENWLYIAPDGKIWFTENTGDIFQNDSPAIGEFDPATGNVNQIAIPSGNPVISKLTADQDGNLWFADVSSHKIGEVNVTANTVTEFAVSSAPGFDVLTGPDGNIYFEEQDGIGEINPTTDVVSEYSLPNGYSMPFNGSDAVIGPDGNVWFTDNNSNLNVPPNVLATLNIKTGSITEVATLGTGSAAGPIAFGPGGNVWFGTLSGGALRLNELNPATSDVGSYAIPIPASDTAVSTFPAVSGPDGNIWFGIIYGSNSGDSGAIGEAVLNSPLPIVLTGQAESISANGATLSGSVNPEGSTAAVAFQYSSYPDFPATVSKSVGSGFSGPEGLAVDAAGDVFVADTGNNAVKEILPSGHIQTVGSGFSGPKGLAVDAAGDVFVADTGNNAVKEILPRGDIQTLGSGFSGPEGVAVDAAGDVFVADTGNNAVKEILPSGDIQTVGSGFSGPVGIAVDAAGDVFVVNSASSNLGAKEVLSDGTMKTIGPSDASALAVDAAGDVFVADFLDVYEILPSGAMQTVDTGFVERSGVAVDVAGDVFVTDSNPYLSDVSEQSFPTMTAPASPSSLSGSTATPVSATLNGLAPATTYYYHVLASGSGGVVSDQQQPPQSFTTAAAPVLTGSTTASASGVEGAGPASLVGASFSDPDTGAQASDFSVAAVDWGDRSTNSAGLTISGNGDNFTVGGSHLYAEEGRHDFSISVKDGAGHTATITGAAKIADAPLSVTGDTLSAQANSALSGALATFTDPGGAEPLSDYGATIDWGDGTSATAGTISGPDAGGAFTIGGSHAYAAAGTPTITITLHHDAVTPDATIEDAVKVSGPVSYSSPGGDVTVKVADGNLEILSGSSVASSTPLDQVTSVAINGADGVANNFTLDYSGGTFVILDGITFNGGALPATPSNSLSIVGGVFGIDTFTFTGAHDGSIQLGTNGQVVNYTNLTPLTNLGTADEVAFQLPDGTVSASLDASPTAGTVELVSGNGTFETTTFAAPSGSLTINAGNGADTVTTTGAFYDDFNGKLTINGAANTLPVHVVGDRSLAAIEGSTSTTVATFSDPNGAGSASDYAATIDWGDGSTATAGIIGGPDANGVFTISGTHVYADENAAPMSLSVVVHRNSAADQTATDRVNVADAPLQGSPQTVSITAQATFSGSVAAFTDANPAAAAGDFSATIDWGDGTTTSGSVTAATGGGFEVAGSHAYAGNSAEHLTVVVKDAGGSSITINSLATASNGADSQYVTSVYEDVLSRAPDADGLAFWIQKLTAGVSRSSVAEGIGTSDEYYQNFVIKPYYLKLLGRAADDNGLSSWTKKMESGATDQQLEADLAASDEFYANAGGTDAAWVGELYQLLLNRTADADGEKFWLGQLASGASRSAVAQGITGSQENDAKLVNADYFHYLGRAADPDGLSFWLKQFANGATNEDVVAGFTGSDEYFKKHTSQPGP